MWFCTSGGSLVGERRTLNPTVNSKDADFSVEEQQFLKKTKDELSSLPNQLLKRAEYFISIGKFKKAEQMLDGFDGHIKTSIIYTQGRGPDDAEANTLTIEKGNGETLSKIVFYRGAFNAYKNGSPAKRDSGYFIDLKPGIHAIRGLIGHETGHLVKSLNFDSDGNLLPDREGNSERFLQDLFPNEFPGTKK